MNISLSQESKSEEKFSGNGENFKSVFPKGYNIIFISTTLLKNLDESY